eukprot:GHVL01016893.1.p1 GENE.GHVL01016893.1~~GHVL01016893.1.p1  ORF type:complete len:216 (+),score=52.38 GHVL01016893.1:572-1219(+)
MVIASKNDEYIKIALQKCTKLFYTYIRHFALRISSSVINFMSQGSPDEIASFRPISVLEKRAGDLLDVEDSHGINIPSVLGQRVLYLSLKIVRSYIFTSLQICNWLVTSPETVTRILGFVTGIESTVTDVFVSAVDCSRCSIDLLSELVHQQKSPLILKLARCPKTRANWVPIHLGAELCGPQGVSQSPVFERGQTTPPRPVMSAGGGGGGSEES